MIKTIRFFTVIFSLFLFYNSQAQIWKKQAKSGNAGLLDVAFISKSTGFVLSSGKVLKTTDTGKTWNQILSGYNRFSRIQFTNDSIGYIIGYDDLVLRTTDGGSNWTLKQTGNSDDDLVTLFAKNKDTLFVAGPDN
ncbi:MAG: WD40/YVTN/BNR-like repeat-containing protein, partial [Bacteroidia bacterium]